MLKIWGKLVQYFLRYSVGYICQFLPRFGAVIAKFPRTPFLYPKLMDRRSSYFTRCSNIINACIPVAILQFGLS